MGVILGRHSAVKIGEETTHGTAVTRTNSLRVLALSGHHEQVDRTPRQHSQGPGIAHGGMPIASTDGQIKIEGLTVEVPAYLNDAGMQLWYAAMGGKSDGGSGPSSYTHTFTLANTLPSYTIEAIEGEDSAGDDSAIVVTGCKCSELVWTVSPTSAPSTLRTTWTARSDAGDTTAGSCTFGDDDYPMMSYHVGDLTWNSGAIDNAGIQSMTLRIQNGLQARNGFGSQFANEPYLTGERLVTLEVVMERTQADALRAAYDSGAASNLTFTVTNTHTAAFTLHSAKIMSFGRNVPINGVVTQTVTFQAFAVVGGGNGLQVVFTNDIQYYTGG